MPDRVPEVAPPPGFRDIMRSYQREGLNWLIFLQSNNLGGCLADDMGLGKTIQTLAMLQYNKENGLLNNEKISSTLLIVPASLVHNWQNEIARFAPGLKVCSYIGHQRKKSTSSFSTCDIVLSSYHTVRQDIDVISKYKFLYVVLDESQVIKNPASQLYKTVMRLQSSHRLVLTGTPVENSLTDLWTQLNFVNPGLLGNLNYFRKEFARPIEKNNSEEKEAKLNRLIRPFILRRTKEEVARDLPEVTEQTVFCDMSDEQLKLYEEEKSAIRNGILNNIESIGVEKSAIMILQGLMKLRQIANHPELADSTFLGSSGKFSAVIEDIRNVIAEGHKILVFSSFVKHLDLFAREFKQDGIQYSMLTGQTANREKVVSDFQDSKETRIFLISLKAGGVGLNLTAADYVFILDPWWNPAAESQALNRAHRIGQDKSVFVYRYISSGTIEEKIVRLQEKKSKLAETFISSNNPLRDLDIKEMFELIG